MTQGLSQKSTPAANGTGPGQIHGLGRDVGRLAVLSRRLVAYNLAYLALAWALALGAIALFWAHPAWYTFALAFVVVSSRQQALLNCHHECVHRKFVPGGRRWNDFVGRWLCAAPVGSPFGAAQARHLTHHRLLGTPEDPDRDLHSGETKQTRRGLARHFIGGVLGGYAGMVLMGPRVGGTPSGRSSARRDLISLVVVQAAIAAVLTLACAWWVYPTLWLAPLATVTTLCHLVRSFVEHAVTDSEMAKHGNRLITIRSNLLERGLVAPYYMNYHAEHHLIPSVPAPRLRELKKSIGSRADAPTVLDRSSYAAAVLDYFRALKH